MGFDIMCIGGSQPWSSLTRIKTEAHGVQKIFALQGLPMVLSNLQRGYA